MRDVVYFEMVQWLRTFKEYVICHVRSIFIGNFTTVFDKNGWFILEFFINKIFVNTSKRLNLVKYSYKYLLKLRISLGKEIGDLTLVM